MAKVAVIADDLTGAADSGAGFARLGWRVEICLAAAERPEVDVLVLSSESRYLAEGEACARMRQAAEVVSGAGWIYKKIDSTLRGHPAAELAELVNALAGERVLVAPAFPAQGRTTVGGIQRVGGTPLERTAFGGEVKSSDLAVLFGSCGLPLRRVSLDALRSGLAAMDFGRQGPALILADAESDDDLSALADLGLGAGLRLFCGSAGLAGALAGRLPTAPLPRVTEPLAPAGGPILGVAGSRNPVTLKQIAAAREAGIGLVEIEPDVESSWTAARQAAARWLDAGRDVILATGAAPDSPLGARGLADRLAQLALASLGKKAFGGLVLTGGETAMAVLAALGATGLALRGEVQPGIPRATLVGGLRPGLGVVTKAGGFGGADALCLAVQALKGGG